MTNSVTAGRGLRALSRSSITAIAGTGILAVLVVVALALQLSLAGQRASSGSNAGDGAGSGATSGGQIIGTVPGFPAEVGGVRLVAAKYTAADILDRPGGALIRSLLASLGVDPASVQVTAGVDINERLAIGAWEIPGAGASALLDAWTKAAGDGWHGQSVAGESVLAGSDATSGEPAIVMARDGRLVYVVSAEPELIVAAVERLR
jgi:hypothetical protein